MTNIITASMTPEGETEGKIDGMITRAEYVKKLKDSFENNTNEILGDPEVAENLMMLLKLKKQNVKDEEDPMEILDIAIETMEKSFAKKQTGSKLNHLTS